MAKVYAAHDLTGGGAGALDAIDGSDLLNDDIALVLHDSYGLMTYLLDVDSSQTESSPEIIRPDDNAGAKRWILQDILGTSSLIPVSVTNFTATLTGQFIELTWHNGTCSAYRLDLNSTTILDNYTGTRYVYRGNLTAGNYQFTIYGLNYLGNPSASGVSQTITISVPSTPNPSSTLYEEMITLSWTDCKTSLPISHYLINTVNCGPSLEFRERVTWTGTKAYSMYAVDIAGNTSEEGTLDEIVASINTPNNIVTTGKTYAIALAITVPSIPIDGAIEVWGSAINNRTGALLLGESYDGNFTHTGLSLIATYYYWVRCRDAYYSVGNWYPSSATAGVAGSTSTNATDYLTILQGSLTESQLYTDLNDRIDLIDTESFVLDPDLIMPNIVAGMYGAYEGLCTIQSAQHVVLDTLTATAATAAADISALQNEVAALVTTPWSNTASYILGNYVVHNEKVYRCIQAYTFPPAKEPGVETAYWEEAEAIATILADVEVRVDDLETEIVLKATETDMNLLDNRVTTAEADIILNANAITLKASQSDFDALGILFMPDFSASNTYAVNDCCKYLGVIYQCITTIDFNPAPTPGVTPGWDTYWVATVFEEEFSTALSAITVNASNITMTSSAIVGPITLLTDIVEDGIVVMDVGDIEDLDVRLTQAGIDIDGAEATILLHTSYISTLEDRMGIAEIDIDAAEAAITLKASQSSLDATDASLTTLTGRVSTAEVDIAAGEAGTWSSISSKATTATVDAIDSRLSIAESDITAGEAGTWASISNKATTATVFALDSRVSGAESNISAGIAGSWSSISSKAATSVVSALDTRVGAAEIAITNGQAGSWSSISEKLQVVTYTNDQKDANAYLRVAALENRMLVYDTAATATWDSGTTYNPGHIIKWDSHYYKCIKTSTNHIPPNVTYWKEITAGMATEWTLKMNANGRVAGVGLMMDSDSSEFIILADKFQVVTSSDTGDPVQVFTVGNIAGHPAVGINGDLIIDGSLSGSSICAAPHIAIGSGGKLTITGDSHSVELSEGDINFYLTVDDVKYPYKSLRHVEVGTGTSGTEITIPGYWKTTPKVMVTPLNISVYDGNASGQTQTINFEAGNLREDPSGSKVYKFTPKATLNYTSNTVTTNIGYYNYSAADNPTAFMASYQSTTITCPSNVRSISVSYKDFRCAAVAFAGTNTLQFLRGYATHTLYYYTNGEWLTVVTNDLADDTTRILAASSSYDIQYLYITSVYTSYLVDHSYTNSGYWETTTWMKWNIGGDNPSQFTVFSYTATLTAAAILRSGTVTYMAIE